MCSSVPQLQHDAIQALGRSELRLGLVAAGKEVQVGAAGGRARPDVGAADDDEHVGRFGCGHVGRINAYADRGSRDGMPMRNLRNGRAGGERWKALEMTPDRSSNVPHFHSMQQRGSA